MKRPAAVLYVLTLVVVVVGADILFLRHHLLARLIANIAIVFLFAVFYLTVLKRRWPQPPQSH